MATAAAGIPGMPRIPPKSRKNKQEFCARHPATWATERRAGEKTAPAIPADARRDQPAGITGALCSHAFQHATRCVRPMQDTNELFGDRMTKSRELTIENAASAP